MFIRRKKALLIIVALNLSAIVTGIGAAATVKSGVFPSASASSTCTHYSPPYFEANPNTQPDLCFEFDSVPAAEMYTDGVAIRDANYISYDGSAHGWDIWYANSDTSYYCCESIGTSTFGSIGSSNGHSKRAGCESHYGPIGMYCTTLW